MSPDFFSLQNFIFLDLKVYPLYLMTSDCLTQKALEELQTTYRLKPVVEKAVEDLQEGGGGAEVSGDGQW